MCHAVCVLYPFQIPLQLVVLFQPIRHKNAGKILIVRLWMVTMACFLVFIYDDRYLAKFPGDMHPHIAFAACGSSIMDHIHGRFVALVYMGFQLALLHHLVYD